MVFGMGWLRMQIQRTTCTEGRGAVERGGVQWRGEGWGGKEHSDWSTLSPSTERETHLSNLLHSVGEVVRRGYDTLGAGSLQNRDT